MGEGAATNWYSLALAAHTTSGANLDVSCTYARHHIDVIPKAHGTR